MLPEALVLLVCVVGRSDKGARLAVDESLVQRGLPELCKLLRSPVSLHREMVARIPCPLVLHICGDTSDRIAYIRESGMSCFHFDSKVPVATARKLASERLALMGGTSNLTVIRSGDEAAVRADVRAKAAARIDIIGPECAVPLDAPYRNMAALTDEVKRLSGSR